MNQQDKSFLITFTTVISVLVLIAVAIFLASRMVSLITVHSEDDARRAAAIEQRIKPVATVAIAAPVTEEAGPVTPMTGEEVYQSVCASCHGAGVLNAPRFGSSDDWAPRFEQGLDTLVTNAVNGIRAMPAKGGNPNLSEQEVKNAIAYMLQESGIEVSEEVAATAEAPAGEAAAPVAAEVPPMTAVAPPPAATADLEHGQQIYSQVCFVCHDAGLAGAPKKGDADAWKARYEQGFDTLLSNAVNGIRGMPPKGGNPTLSENDIRDAVAYMLEESGIAIPAPAPVAEEMPPAEEEEPAPTAEEPAPKAEVAAQPLTATDELLAAIQEATAAAQKAAEAAQKAAEAAQQAAQSMRKPEQEAAPEAEAEQPAPAEEKPAQEEAPAPAQEKPAPEQSQEEAAPVEEKAAAPAEEKAAAPEEPAAAQVKIDQPAEVTPESPPIQIPDTVELALGKQTYDSACVICHEAGVAGAPKFGSESDWGPRMAKGFETLLQNAVNGIKGMPPKGGRPDLTEEQIANAIGYMVSNAR